MVNMDFKNNSCLEITLKNSIDVKETIPDIKNNNIELSSLIQTELDEPPSKKARLIENQNSVDLCPGTKNQGQTISKPEILSIPIKHQSPKKKLQFQTNNNKPEKKLFIYGNYSRYYGYRCTNDFSDARLDVFKNHLEMFEHKEVLDIGCNSGLLTCNIAEQFSLKNITGIDIDRKLIDFARTFVRNIQKKHTDKDKTRFPFNVSFIHGNYVLRDDVLLEIETEQFDCILCLSVTKWIQLNFGDSGLKQVFKRMFLQLRPGGTLILEAQPWDGYKRRKKLTPEIQKNYHQIKLRPEDFSNYLLSSEIGFVNVEQLAIPDQVSKGFRRPIQVFHKATKKD